MIFLSVCSEKLKSSPILVERTVGWCHISTSVTFEEAIGIQVHISLPTIGLYSKFTLNPY